MRRIVVAGIGTNVGKTIAAAIIAEALGADYWKPIQAGHLDASDTMTVQGLISHGAQRCHPESYRLIPSVSPHHAARLDGIEINLENIQIPMTTRPLVMEGCGGFLVPVNERHLVMDLFARWQCEYYIVSQHYLGSINHTLLTLETMTARGLNIKGIIFNGEENLGTEHAIMRRYPVPMIGRLLPEVDLNSHIVKQYSDQWKPLLLQ